MRLGHQSATQLTWFRKKPLADMTAAERMSTCMHTEVIFIDIFWYINLCVPYHFYSVTLA